MGKPRKTEVVRIVDPKKRCASFSKRRPTIFSKAKELSTAADSHVSVLVRSSTGKTYYEGYERGEPIEPPRKGKVDPSMVSREWEEALVKQEFDACTTREEVQSVVAKYEYRLAYCWKRSGYWENHPSVPEILSDEEIDSILQNVKNPNPLLWAPCKDSVGRGDSPVNSAAGGASDPKSSGLHDCVFNMNHLPQQENLAIGGLSNLTCSKPDGSEFNLDAFLDLYEDCISDGDSQKTVGGG